MALRLRSAAVGSVLLCALVAHAGPAANGAHSLAYPPLVERECLITRPNGVSYPVKPAGGNHGNEALVTQLCSGPVVFRPGGPGSVQPDGALAMKWGWWRARPGQLTIQGERIDAPAAALRSSIPCCYGELGFQSSAVIFPSPGCWRVTGRVGDGSLTFVVKVEKVGEGPIPRR